MKKLKTFFDYLFYKYYWFQVRVGNKDIAPFSSTLIITFLFFTCISCEKRDIESILINNNSHSEINLFQGKYTVHFMDKADSNIKFTISKDEIKKIKELYLKEKIYNLGQNVMLIEDYPLIMPTYDTTYTISLIDGYKQIICVRTDFRKNPLDNEKYRSIKIFIEKINSILKYKKEILNAPKSNMIDM